MARTHANAHGPAPRTAVDSIQEQLDSQIQVSFRQFHEHSKSCRDCRNPVRAYEEGRDLCPEGRHHCINITKLLYKKAEHVPGGTFTVDYKQGWEAVDGLIRIITHYNQGNYSNCIVDLKRRTPPASDAGSDSFEYRGSQYQEDLRRQQRAAQLSCTERRSPHRTSSTLATYGDPRNSFLDVTTGLTQADISPASSNRSVHFDSTVHVREFHPNT